MNDFSELMGTSNPFVLKVQLRLADTDSVGHINNAAYVKFMETARTEWHVHVHNGRNALENWNWILGEIRLRFTKEGYLSDSVEIYMWVSHIGKKSWNFSYLIINQNKEILGIAQTSQICYNYEIRQSQSITSEILSDLKMRKGNILKEFE